MKEKSRNVPRSKTKDYNNSITVCTSIAFASSLNPKYFNSNNFPTAEHISRLSFSIGFWQSGYGEDAKIFPYSGLSVSYNVKEYWLKESLRFAERLLVEAGMIDKNTNNTNP